jgi:hypothetical protein
MFLVPGVLLFPGDSFVYLRLEGCEKRLMMQSSTGEAT